MVEEWKMRRWPHTGPTAVPTAGHTKAWSQCRLAASRDASCVLGSIGGAVGSLVGALSVGSLHHMGRRVPRVSLG